MIKESIIEEVKEKNNIVDVVGKYCTLKKRGSSHWACCPLPNHSEKTPSFSVNEHGQFYKCFGCGRGGNVINFIMTMENLDFVGAVRLLAEQVGVEIEEDERDKEKAKKDRSERDRMLALMKTTALFYVHNLKTPEAEKHRKYLESRGIDGATATAFGIGASLDSHSLVRHLKDKGFTEEEMLKAGVCSRYERERNGAKSYDVGDALYGRLIIPIINNLSGVVAFGGRLLEKKPNFAKYKNTQETDLFIKNRTLYNINNLKKEKAKGNLTQIIMVEGYMDAISLYTAGFKNVVASMGTSLTLEQARILKRYADTVIISYDGDGAGQKATIRGLEILKNEGLNVRVVVLPDGLDPDDVIKKYGAEKYEQLLMESVPLVDFKLLNLSKSYNIKDLSDKRRYIAEAIKVIAECESESEREDLLRKLGKETGTTYESLKRDTDRLSVGENKKESDFKPTVAKPVTDGLINAERFVLCAKLFKKTYADRFDVFSVEYSSLTREKIADAVQKRIEEGLEVLPASLSQIFSEDELEEYNAVISAGDNVFKTVGEEKFFTDCVGLLQKNRLEEDLKALNLLFKQESDVEKRKEIAKKIAEITLKMKK